MWGLVVRGRTGGNGGSGGGGGGGDEVAAQSMSALDAAAAAVAQQLAAATGQLAGAPPARMNELLVTMARAAEALEGIQKARAATTA